MSVIKPGKLGIVGSRQQKKTGVDKEPEVGRQIWDDYALGDKRGKKKQEYERGAGNVMRPKASVPRPRDTGEKFTLAQAGEEEVPHSNVDTAAIEQRLGYEFRDKNLIVCALTHRSALGIKERADYERLEFLGDAVLDLSVAHLLSDKHPEAREGDLSKMRAALVNTQALAGIAKLLDLGPHIRLGRGELSSGGNERPSILADVVEALIGGIYRDGGYEIAFQAIEAILGSALAEVTPYDPKTELQEALHAAGSEPPSYLLEMVEGPEHAPTFVTVVTVDGEIAGRGRGATKKASQQEAASQALARLLPPGATVSFDPAEIIASLLLCRIPANTDQAAVDPQSEVA